MFIFLIAKGCYIKYVPIQPPPAEVGTGGLAAPSTGVELACVSKTGERQIVAQYDAVQCPIIIPSDSEDEDENEG